MGNESVDSLACFPLQQRGYLQLVIWAIAKAIFLIFLFFFEIDPCMKHGPSLDLKPNRTLAHLAHRNMHHLVVRMPSKSIFPTYGHIMAYFNNVGNPGKTTDVYVIEGLPAHETNHF